jgi:hypothetical protein
MIVLTPGNKFTGEYYTTLQEESLEIFPGLHRLGTKTLGKNKLQGKSKGKNKGKLITSISLICFKTVSLI